MRSRSAGLVQGWNGGTLASPERFTPARITTRPGRVHEVTPFGTEQGDGRRLGCGSCLGVDGSRDGRLAETSSIRPTKLIRSHRDARRIPALPKCSESV